MPGGTVTRGEGANAPAGRCRGGDRVQVGRYLGMDCVNRPYGAYDTDGNPEFRIKKT